MASISNSTGKGTPYNVESLTINYNDDQSVVVPAEKLRFCYEPEGNKYYYIESNDDSTNVVYFYNESGGLTGNVYQFYDVRFVENGASLGANMPPNPTYEGPNQYSFVNWEYGEWDGQGDPFLPTTIVNDDLVVFAHKVSSGLGGIYIDVVNDDDQLLKRIVELYNKDATVPISVDDIITNEDNGFGIVAYDSNGKKTTEDYLSGAVNKGWQDDDSYYRVLNYDADNQGGTGITNTKLKFDEVAGIYVYFKTTKTGEQKNMIEIPVGNYAGDLAKMMVGDADDTTMELRVIQGGVESRPDENPENPTYEDPTYAELKDLIQVDVKCKTNDKHQLERYELKEGYKLIRVDDLNATVTITGAPYVEAYNAQKPNHQIEGADTKQIKVKNENGNWVLSNGVELVTLTFNVTCPAAISGFEKDLVDAEKADGALTSDVDTAIENSVEIENAGFTIPDSEEDFVVIPNGGSVKLLYSITVTGQSKTVFKVTDDGAELVASAAHVTRENGVFTGTIPEGKDSVTFYVSKEFNKDNIPGNKLTNTAKIELGDNEGGYIDPELPTEDEESIDGEEGPALPTEQEINDLFDVELDCISGVGHQDQTYENLVYNKDMFKNYNKAADGTITVEMTVVGADYLEKFNEASENVVHVVDGDETKTITLTYNNGWTAPEGSSPIEFDVKCSGTGNYDINGFTKDLIAGNSEKEVAQKDGVEVENYTIPEEKEAVVIPYNGEVTLLYKLTVTGNNDSPVNFVVTDKGAEFVKDVGGVDIDFEENDSTFTGIVPANQSVSFYVSKTFDADDIIDGKLVNEALIAGTGEDEGASVDPGIDDIEEEVGGEEGEPAGTVTITPADLTIYEGGEGGYDAVVNEDGNQVEAAESTSLPHPLFKITVPDGSSIDPETLTFTNGSNVWEVVHDGDNLYHFEVAKEGMTPVRVTYTNAAGKVVTSDEFTPEENSYAEYTIRLYPGNNADDFSNVTAIADDGARYAINAENQTGKLTVRAVDGTQEESVSAIVTNENADSVEKVDAGEAVAVEPENGTTYSLNDTEVKVDENDSKPSLLFDTIIDDEVNRTEMLEDKVDEALGGADADRDYEIKYIDLVDANNGNAWIASENGTDILWGYPEGTDIDTEFQILHFKELHRDGETTGFDPEELGAIDVNDESQLEHVTITNTYEGILFHVDKANFSPFALTWETDNGGSDTPGGDTPGGDDPWYPPYNPGDDDKPSGLNTEDHFSYVVGYEDGMVKPQRSITRAEVATIFYRLLEDDVRDDYDTTRNNFSDVTSDSWYNQTVSTLASMGILKGYEDGTFRPNASITRAEFAAIATRFFEETGATYEPGTFTDVTGDEWFAGAIMDAVNLGLIGGYEDGTVRPNNNITRAEACAIVNRTLGRVPDADHLLPADEMTTWPDNPSSAWFYADMQEATNGHEYEWITEDGNKIEEWTDILDKDWNDR